MVRISVATLLLTSITLAPVFSSAASPEEALRHCRAEVRDHPNETESYRCFYLTANRYGVWDEAARSLEDLLSLNPGNHQARFHLAAVLEGRGSQRAEQLYGEAVAGFAETGAVADEIYARVLLSRYLRRQGRLLEAGSALQPATDLIERESVKPELVAQVRIGEAWQAMSLGDHGKALGPLLEAEALAFPDGPADLQTVVLSTMGRAYWGLGMFREGIEAYNREAELNERLGDLRAVAAPRYNIALLAQKLFADGEMERAACVGFMEQALESAVAVSHLPLEARSLILLGQTMDDEELAASHLNRALDISRRMGELRAARQALLALAQLVWRNEPDRRDEALGWVGEEVASARSLGDLQAVARALAVRAWMLWDSGDSEAGIAAYLETLAAVEKIRDQQPEGTLRARIFSQWIFPYYRFAGGLLYGLPGSTEPDRHLDLAFQTIERMRARVLLDELDSAGARPALDRNDPTFLRHTELLGSISAIQKRLSDPALPPAERGQVLEELSRLEAQEMVVRDELARADPDYRKLRAPTFPTLDEVQQALAADQALLSFQLARTAASAREPGEGGAWLIAITRQHVNAYALPERDELEGRINAFLGLLQRRDGSQTRAAERLYRDLLGEGMRDLGSEITRLVILPDRRLHRLPFGALHAADGEPLALHRSITYAPSATVWLRWIKQRASAVPARGLAFADPALSSASEGLEERGGDPWFTGLRLQPLPHAREEAEAMVRSIGNNSRLLQSTDASEQALKQADLSKFGLLHFAAHAVVDNAKPERSAVLLSAGSDAEDGMLQMREIVDLDLDGRVVILTACRSASGVVMEGEGVVGLARAFFVAGARAVIGGLWLLKDDEAALLMKDFGGLLAGGRSLSDALMEARAARLRAGDPAAAWAGIVLLGDGDYVPLPAGGKRPVWLQWLLAGLLLGALCVALRMALRTR